VIPKETLKYSHSSTILTQNGRGTKCRDRFVEDYFFFATFRFGAALRVVFFATFRFGAAFLATFRFGAAFFATFRFGAAFFFAAMFLKRVTCDIKLDRMYSLSCTYAQHTMKKKYFCGKLFLFTNAITKIKMKKLFYM
jgi:hypothetical protein